MSRVNHINFSGIENNILKIYLENNFDITFSNNILNYVDGSIGQAISIIEDNILEKFEIVDEMFEFIKNKDVINSMITSTTVKLNEYQLLDYFEYLLQINLCYSCIKYVEKAKIRLKYNGNYDIVIDNMLLKVIDSIV